MKVMKSLERPTVFTKDQCLGHDSNVTMKMHERKQEWRKNGEREGIKQHREKESKEKGIDLTVCNTLASLNC